jgi:hypothetical protein
VVGSVWSDLYVVHIGLSYASSGIKKKKKINLIRSEESLTED